MFTIFYEHFFIGDPSAPQNEVGLQGVKMDDFGWGTVERGLRGKGICHGTLSGSKRYNENMPWSDP